MSLFNIGSTYELILQDPLLIDVLTGISLQDIGGSSHWGWILNVDQAQLTLAWVQERQ
jgi:hypothetical protein